MAEDTNTSAAAEDALSLAAAAAVAEQIEDPPAEEPVAPEPETAAVAASSEASEVDEEGLPVDHKERSDLGRKLGAMHRRNDELENQLMRIATMMEKLAQPPKPLETADSPTFDPNEPVTYNEMLKILEHRETQKQRAQTDYQNQYAASIERMVAEYTDESGKPDVNEINGVLDEMKVLTYQPSPDPEKDAIYNLRRAERAYLRKKYAVPAPKPNPIKGEPPKSPLGTMKSGHIPESPRKPVQLDAAAEAYLKYVSATDGAEKAAKLRAGIPAHEA